MNIAFNSIEAKVGGNVDGFVRVALPLPTLLTLPLCGSVARGCNEGIGG